jgi:drug/metabolite transporter superfamily protein YnfA
VRILSEFGKFWYDLLVGDDWKIAVSVVVALTLSALLLTRTGAPDQVVAVVGGAMVVTAFCFSLILDFRGKK